MIPFLFWLASFGLATIVILSFFLRTVGDAFWRLSFYFSGSGFILICTATMAFESIVPGPLMLTNVYGALTGIVVVGGFILLHKPTREIINRAKEKRRK